MTVNGFDAAAASISTVAPIRISEKFAKLGYCLRLKRVNSWILWRVNICCVKLIVRHAACSWIRIWSRRVNIHKIIKDRTEREAFRPLIQFACRSLVIVGSATNFAVLYTATTAARIYRYEVVIPLDGVNAKRQYEHEYAVHQLTILPASAHKQFRFTTLGMIEFD